MTFLNDFIYLFFRERGREGEREREKHQCVVASHTTPIVDLAHNPGMCPDWESNQQPFGSQACVPSTELHKPEWSNDFQQVCKDHSMRKGQSF